MTWMIVHAGDLLDHGGDARQRPQRRVKPVRGGAATEGFLHAAQIRRCEAGPAARPARALQRTRPAGFPLVIPAAHALAAHLQLLRDGCLCLAAREKPRRRRAPCLEGPEISSGTNTRLHPPSKHPGATSVTILCEAQ